MNVIDPRGMPIVEWCDRTGAALEGFVSVMKIESENEWPRWGAHVLKTLNARSIPNPFQFPDFEEWAMRFNQLISTL